MIIRRHRHKIDDRLFSLTLMNDEKRKRLDALETTVNGFTISTRYSHAYGSKRIDSLKDQVNRQEELIILLLKHLDLQVNPVAKKEAYLELSKKVVEPNDKEG